MKFFLIIITILLRWESTDAQNHTEHVQNKTKRAPQDQMHNEGENRPSIIYLDNLATGSSHSQAAQHSPTGGFKNFYSPPPSKPLALVSVQQPIQVFEQGNPKQVAAQQVLYEFQQTPTNAESNVQVKQLFQPSDFTGNIGNRNQPNSQLNNHQSVIHPQAPGYVTASETIVSPVHHNTFVNHNQNAAAVNYLQPYNIQPQHIHTQQQIPGKYLYLNGKIIYQPTQNIPGQITSQNIPQQTNARTFYQNNHMNMPYQQNAQKLPLVNLSNRPGASANYGQRSKPFSLSNIPPITKRFQPPLKHQMQSITKPSSVSENTEVQNEEKEEEKSSSTREDDEQTETEEDEEDPSYYHENDDDDDDTGTHDFKGFFFDDEEDDRRSHKHEDDDEEEGEDGKDSKRGSSKQVFKKTPKGKNIRPEKFRKNDSYKWSEGFSTSSKYETPTSKGGKKGKKKPKGEFKTTRYSKRDGKPKIETIEGKMVCHKKV